MRAREVWLKIEQLNADLEEARPRFLRLSGWRNTSSTPGCYWLWVKEFDGIQYAVDESTAIRIERGRL